MKILSKYKIWRYPLFLKIVYFFQNKIQSNSICLTYWINSNIFIWSTKIKPYNWGDYVNMKLAELISGKTIIPSYFYAKKNKIAMMGSILPWAMDKDTIVWGCGCLSSHDSIWKNVEPPKKILAVRGPLTRQVLMQYGIECPEVYGDPALLFPRFYQPKIEKKYNYGIILHVSTNISKLMVSILKSIYGDSIVVINPNVFSKWNNFIDSILSCEHIISSSLHGIIIADAYGVPNVWITVTNQEHPDNNFKFKDYYMSIGKDINTPIYFTERTMVDEKLEKYVRPVIDLDQLLDVCPLS